MTDDRDDPAEPEYSGNDRHEHSGRDPADSRRQARLDDLVGAAGENPPGDSPADASPDSALSVPDGAVENSVDEFAETVELGVALLAHLEDGELSLAEAVDRIETVTTDPALTREILDTAELRGVIAREEGVVRSRSGAFVRFERDVIRREGEFTCRRCGASLSTGYFIRFDAGEHGPFGSSCIRKVTGRE